MKSSAEVYDTVKLWLIENNCSLIKQEPPSHLEAKYSANIPMFHLGPRDDHPKKIEVRFSPFGGDVFLDFSFTQKIDRVGNSGYLFWGMKLGELYQELGVNVTEIVWSRLIQEELVRRAIKNRKRLMIVLLAISLLGLVNFWNEGIDTMLMLFIVFIIPSGLLTFWDLQEHKKLSQHKV